MGLTFAQCKALGIEHLYPTGGKPTLPTVAPPVKSAAPDDGMNKLERAFWGRLCEAKHRLVFRDAWHHSLKLAVIGDRCRWYTPDFHATALPGDRVVIYEAKGWMREDASLKLIAAASRYPCFAWVLVQRDRGTWRCCGVSDRGFSRDFYTPDWLR